MVAPIGAIKPFSIGGLGGSGGGTGAAGSSGGGGGGFGKLLNDSIGKLDQAQAQAAQQTQQLATGQATNLSSVVMSVEQASLEVQLASQVRNKVLDAYNDIFRMQI